jgi:hypothetical protein
MGLIATLTLVLLVGLGGVGVYLTAPGGQQGGVSPRDVDVAATPSAEAAGLRPVEPPPDASLVSAGQCYQQPANYDEVMARLVVPSNQSSYEIPLSSVRMEPNSTYPDVMSYRLLDGSPPPVETIQATTGILAQYLACSPLRQVNLVTEDFLLRFLYGSGTWRHGVPFLLGLWEDANQDSASVDGVIESSNPWIYDFRVFYDGRIGAYLDFSDPVAIRMRPGDQQVLAYPAFDQRGFIVFRPQPDGSWLIDDAAFAYPSLHLPPPVAESTPAP